MNISSIEIKFSLNMNAIISRLVVVLFLCIPAATLHAQSSALDRGSLNIAGDASFTSTGSGSEIGDERNTQLYINPTAQYFVVPGFSVGGLVVLSLYSAGETTSTTIGAGPSVTYYFTRGERKLHPFVSGTVSLQRSSVESTNFEDTASSIGYRGSGGVLLMLSQSVGITGELFYRGQSSDDFDSNTYGLAFGVSAFIF